MPLFVPHLNKKHENLEKKVKILMLFDYLAPYKWDFHWFWTWGQSFTQGYLGVNHKVVKFPGRDISSLAVKWLRFSNSQISFDTDRGGTLFVYAFALRCSKPIYGKYFDILFTQDLIFQRRYFNPLNTGIFTVLGFLLGY